jgi:hypothetical protein
MYIALKIFGHGWSMQSHEYDSSRARLVYLQYARSRKGTLSFVISLESTECGGIQLRVFRNGKTQGWSLRGPVEHWESSY